jgi:hypothetical protein
MLIIASDIHLSDGTCAKSIAPRAFALFTDRVRELAFNASFTDVGDYKPIESIDLVLMGDILDPLHSTHWLDTTPGSSAYIRPWSDPQRSGYAAKLQQVTRAILTENAAALAALRRLAQGEVVLLPPSARNKPDFESKERIAPQVRLHYMIGNHDWYYHLPGAAFDAIRQEMIDALGLSNPANLFPWTLEEYAPLKEIFARYHVYGRHGDMYDTFNYDCEKGRDAGTLGDVFAMEVLNRFPLVVAAQMGSDAPAGLMDSLRKLTNVRPVLATPLWISAQIKQHAATSTALQERLKKAWDTLADELLQVDFVRQADKAFQFDVVDAMELVVKISKHASFNTINDLVVWARGKFGGDGLSFAKHALCEPAFLNEQARYIIYGHTHHHEIVPLDAWEEADVSENQIYFNSGTWHSYYDLAVRNPLEQKFVPYQAMTYLTFYQTNERGERNFEAWSGAFA